MRKQKPEKQAWSCLVDLENGIENIRSIIKCGQLDFARFIQQVDTKQLSLSTGIRPGFDVRLGSDARFDRPFVLIGTEAADRMNGS